VVAVLLVHVLWPGQRFWSWEMQMFLVVDVRAVLHSKPSLGVENIRAKALR
jgi:hypothetical protein